MNDGSQRDFVSRHAAAQPDKRACVDWTDGRAVTYRQLDALADGMAAALLRHRPDLRGQPVALLARNSIDYLAITLACHRTGAVFLPLNWRLTAAEIRGQLTDAGAVLAIRAAEFAATMQAALPDGAICLDLDALSAEAQAPHDPVTPADAAPDDPFILLYTSGTTGAPKGAVITRRNAVYQSFNFQVLGQVGPDSVLATDAPMFHVVGLIVVALTALQCGATLAISDRFAAPRTLARLLDDGLGVTHYFGVPYIAQALIDDAAYQPAALNRLKGLFLGGASCPRALIERLSGDGVTVSNGLGMSEAGSLMHMPLDIARVLQHPLSVGLPAPALEVRVVAADGRDAADGEPGELLIRGPAVTPGYWRQPEATEAAFTDGWLRTGDVVTRAADGVFTLLDRLKDIYISGGENVYSAEVENVLMGIPGVADVAVIGAPDERWGEVGLAFVVRRPGAALTADQVMAAAQPLLAAYKRPRQVRFIDTIPRNAAGKIQKAALKALV